MRMYQNKKSTIKKNDKMIVKFYFETTSFIIEI